MTLPPCPQPALQLRRRSPFDSLSVVRLVSYEPQVIAADDGGIESCSDVPYEVLNWDRDS